MRQFITVLFGGLVVIFGAIGISWGAGILWNVISPHVAPTQFVPAMTTMIEALTPGTAPGTVVDGLHRAIRYTAGQEEDLLGYAVSALTGGPDGRISAKSYVLKDLTANKVIAHKNEDTLMPLASLTKLVTAVVARKVIDADTRIVLTPQIINTYGNTAGLKAGETYKASDLMYPLLMVSSNDAAEALAVEYGRKRFILAMNEFTQSIGAYRTYFADVSGLSDKNESTANDIAIITDWIRKNDPEILQYTELKSITIKNHTWVNPAHFLSWSNYLGGKNGFTDTAEKTSTSLFTLGASKHVYVVVLLGSDNRDADVIRLINKVK